MGLIRNLIGGGVVAGVAVFGATQAMDDNTTRGEDGQITEAGGLGVLKIQVGDCVQLPDGLADEVASIEGVPCSTPHDGQTFVEFDLDDGAYPGEAQVQELAGNGCIWRWASVFGTPYDQMPEYDAYYFTPTSEGWLAGDQEVTCIIMRVDGAPMVGSMVTGYE